MENKTQTITITDQYNQKHVFTLPIGKVSVAELEVSVRKTARKERVENLLGHTIIANCLKEFLKVRLPQLVPPYDFYMKAKGIALTH
jgi:hypothetical protein